MTEKLTAEQSKLAADNVNLARRLAMLAWSKDREGLDGPELVAVAMQGLVTAAKRFDPTRPDINPDDLINGKAFSGFARQRINGAILDWKRAQDHVPRRQRKVYIELLDLGLKRGASPEQLSELTGMDVEQVRAIIFAVETTFDSTDSAPPDWETSDYQDRSYPSEESVESSAFVSEVQRAMSTTIDSLPTLQRSVIVLRYYSGLSLPKIAQTLETRMSAVRIAHSEALATIHSVMRKVAN